ncbi:hypothetical protein QQP08_004754, partial [Theobroma cacao]
MEVKDMVFMNKGDGEKQLCQDRAGLMLCQELAPSGRMVLMFNGRQTADPANKDSCYKWDLLPCRGLILPGFT